MYEYYIVHKVTGEESYVWGYNYTNAMSKAPGLNPDEWKCVHAEYID